MVGRLLVCCVQALAHELAASYWQALKEPRYAMTHTRDAHYLYSLLGHNTKCRLLEAAHPTLRHHGTPDAAVAALGNYSSPSASPPNTNPEQDTRLSASEELPSPVSGGS